MSGGTPPPNEVYAVELLTAQHDRAAFSCGDARLDRYVREQAGQDARRSVAVTFVAVPRGTKVVAGYYSLASTSVDAGELPPTLAKKLPRYDRLPATLLGRLAVDRQHQHRRLGEYLLVHALSRSLTASDEIASVAVVVDAIDERAVAFYRAYEFVPFLDQPRRLFLPMQSVAKLYRS